jgi:arylsulfatase A-like enzyme
MYGDVIEELDWSVAKCSMRFDPQGIERNTLVLFTSDNGPWLPFRDHGGSAGPLKQGKGTTWEGGVRTPAIFWWPGLLSSWCRDGNRIRPRRACDRCVACRRTSPRGSTD